jgi:NAD(P)-dependent dehydrogenase (short-subunit alcohol dehydrogenase family)
MSWDLGAGLDGKVMIVTGAAGGIGASVTTALASAGVRVLAVDLDREATREVVAGLGSDGCAGIGADLRDLSTHSEVLAAAGRLGPLHGLVHCAAVLRRRSQVRDVTEADWDAQMEVNLKGSFFLCRAVAEALVEQGQGGRIITFTSQGWWTGGFGGSVVYAASKGGVASMTRGLARTYGPHGITVNSIAPGQARTRMLLDDLDDNVLRTMTEQTPLRRIAEPEEIAGVAVFLASRHASFITGATINVSGGFLMY